MRILSTQKLYLKSVATRGGALIITLWVTFGLVSLALYFGHSMSLELQVSENRMASLAADQAVQGAARYAVHLLSNLQTPGVLPTVQSYVQDAVPVGDATFWFVGRDPDQASPTLPYFALTDESAKINVNSASQEMLEALPRMTSSLAAAIIDWRDTNSDLSTGGAEDETYLRRNPPHRAKNSNFESLEELRLVFGMDMDVLYGEDANQNGILDPNENDGDTSLPSDNKDGKLDPGIIEYLTVATPIVNGPGGPVSLINASTASEAVLTCIPGIGKDGASALIAYRKGHTDQLATPEWFTNALTGAALQAGRAYLTNASAYFSADIAAVGGHGRGYRRQRFIFDLSGSAPRIMSRQDLTALGWALGRDARETAMNVKRNP
ncbi:MAG: general secretion pathway protein GspK [Verrucomicrobia bacterium]|nr:general secretion pathway protein GspK [Verrucomicrobiota bacterium]MBI3867628.1 general secretion pathway protein GspK [Verrucomicrobiota bacterium]